MGGLEKGYKGSYSQQMGCIRALTIQDSIIESKTINYILFIVFC